ncbi:MAG: DUF1801 domain-containing protein [Bacteroidia bacterium]|jgi:hypothetical protein
MRIEASTPEAYLESVPEERKAVVRRLHELIMENLPQGFEAGVGYGMLGYIVPHSLYPAGYHCDPKQPLPFMGLASQKNNISFYHMGLYADQALLDWFVGEYPKYSKTKLDMGKSCIRFKKEENIPFPLLAELVRKMKPEDWIRLYEANLKR